MRSSTITLLGLLLAPILTPAANCLAADDYSSIASQFYPPALKDATLPGVSDAPEWTYKVAELDGHSGPRYLVVAYSNGAEGLLRIIQLTPTGPVLAASPQSPSLFDRHPKLELNDLDGDGTPEIIASYATGNRPARNAWIYQWSAGDVHCLNPADADAADDRVAFNSPTFVDLNGDGKLDVVEPTEEFGTRARAATPEESQPETPDQSYNTYQLTESGYAAGGRVVYYGLFVRGKGPPQARTEHFAATPGRYRLRIINGGRSGDRADSGEVAVNGKTIFGPEAFREKARVLAASLTLTDDNAVGVELRSAPGAEIHVFIEPEP